MGVSDHKLNIGKTLSELSILVLHDPHSSDPSRRPDLLPTFQFSRSRPSLVRNDGLKEGPQIFFFAGEVEVSNKDRELGISQPFSTCVPSTTLPNAVDPDSLPLEGCPVAFFHRKLGGFVRIHDIRQGRGVLRSFDHLLWCRMSEHDVSIHSIPGLVEILLDKRDSLLLLRCEEFLLRGIR